MKVKFWGTRGSIATPGPSTIRYGGNTTCLEVLFEDGSRIILDAGTGIRKLGQELMETSGQSPVHLFLTHAHWDHIQGFPFFAPAYDRKTRICVYGFQQAYDRLREILTNQMESKFFPVNFNDLNADIQFVKITGEAYSIGATKIQAIACNHPGTAHGFRITENGRSLVFLTDNELRPPTDVITDWPDFVDFCSGADLLIHDAMYTDKELETRQGWGHSSHLQAVDLALEAGVGTCVLFHHDPDRDDDMVDAILQDCAARINNAKSSVRCLAAVEDDTLDI